MPRIFKRQTVRIIALILGVILIGGLLIGWTMGARSRETQEIPTLSQTEKRGFFCVLVAAKDRTSGLCDVMMLVSLNRETGDVAVLQIPRDTYAHVGDGNYRKINGAPSSVGMQSLCEVLEDSFGITVDRYVRLSADAFRRAVDAVGGVEVELTEPMVYEDPAQGLSIRLEKGKQTLDGECAEWFVRYRSDYVRGDLGRLDAQKIFLAAFARKALETRSPISLVRLASALLSETESDLDFGDLTGLIGAVTDREGGSVSFVTAPGNDVTGKDGGSYYVLSAPAMERLLREHFGKTDAGFDPDGRFLNRENEDFLRVYGADLPFRVYSAEEIGAEGLSIPRRSRGNRN